MLKLDTVSETATLDGRKGQGIRLYAFVCRYCGMVHLEGQGNAERITYVRAARQARVAGWTRWRREWYCPSCEGMDRFVKAEELEITFVPLAPVRDYESRN